MLGHFSFGMTSFASSSACSRLSPAPCGSPPWRKHGRRGGVKPVASCPHDRRPPKPLPRRPWPRDRRRRGREYLGDGEAGEGGHARELRNQLQLGDFFVAGVPGPARQSSKYLGYEIISRPARSTFWSAQPGRQPASSSMRAGFRENRHRSWTPHQTPPLVLPEPASSRMPYARSLSFLCFFFLSSPARSRSGFSSLDAAADTWRRLAAQSSASAAADRRRAPILGAHTEGRGGGGGEGSGASFRPRVGRLDQRPFV